ncbi:hypothetical protein [Aliarcobacter butzleri]|uniref:hypothetical protein n=1 Tax=Aliarcobacter butzleri TaxID=28197 RepID=UPI0021B343D7|nr:hypothetical protein [Aliarcobacter butzleri]MCT7536559.1 hypothetical protein [Aliarcobacter butzleri]MCT7623245.1 hypothetical protein [Aliarcobacter butzleri]
MNKTITLTQFELIQIIIICIFIGFFIYHTIEYIKYDYTIEKQKSSFAVYLLKIWLKVSIFILIIFMGSKIIN